MSIKQNLLITGHTSFLGKTFMRNLQGYELIKYSRIQNKKDSLSFSEESLDDLMKIVENRSIKMCVHIANFKDKNQEYDTEKEIEFIAKLNSYGIKKIVYISSYWVDILKLANDEYVSHKLQIEHEIMNKFSYNILRVGDIFGSNDTRDKLIPYLLVNENQSNIKLYGNPENIIKPIHVNDVCKVLNEIITNKSSKNRTIDLYSDAYSLEEFIKIFKESRNKKFSVEYKNMNNLNFEYKSTSNEKTLIENDLKKQLFDLDS
tara:strand:- start:669 stop:1451 length:783 start_codon:yes stop_codon:yes gene_type:complete